VASSPTAIPWIKVLIAIQSRFQQPFQISTGHLANARGDGAFNSARNFQLPKELETSGKSSQNQIE